MSVITITTNPTAVQSIPLKPCPCPRCTHSFKEGTGWLPDLPNAFEQARGTGVDPLHPLTRVEMLELEICFACAHDYRFRKFGIKMYPCYETSRLMGSWAERNMQRMDADRARRQQAEEMREASNLAFALRHQDDHVRGAFVNETISTAPAPKEKRKKPGQRYMNANRPKREEKPKKDKGTDKKRRKK
jgi:hypothetical protein